MDKEEKRLNKEQKEAVEYGDGPLLIIAGAGTGKTTVITERIKWLVASGKAKTSEILALTFTDKAAREMEERVDIAMPYGYTDMWISTFHSFCDRILRQEAIHIGLNSAYKLMTEAETTQFLIKNLFKFELEYFRPLGNPTKFIGGMLQHFSRLKDEDVAANEYLRWLKVRSTKSEVRSDKSKEEEMKKFTELANAYQRYEELKIKEGLMDFGDLIANTLKLFRTRKNVLKEYRNRFKYFLVDEYQDTNIAQNQLVELLAGSKANLTVVADDDQAIYRWRGAAISNVIQFRKQFPKVKVITLTKNYRSTQEILDRAYQLIQNNNPDRLEIKEKIDKRLKAVRKIEGWPIEFLHADRVENEAEIVARKIKDLILPGSSIANDPGSEGTCDPGSKLKRGYDYKDFAVLVRANNHAEPFVRALARHNIPYQFLGPGQLFRQSEVKDLIAYLKVLYSFEDNVAFYRVLTLDYFDLSARDIAAIVNFSRRNHISLFEACEQIEKILVSPKTKEKIDWLVKMVHRHLKLIPKETAGQIVYYFLQDSGLLKKLAEYQTVSEEKISQNIAKFFDRLKTYEVDHEDASVPAVVDWINLSMDLGESPLANNFDWVAENKVNILTVHSAKGLEFPVVFLVNLVAERFPTRERKESIPIPKELIKEVLPIGDHHQQEERRLFYVGMTRAGDRLFLTAANYYGEGKREKKISPFVVEVMGGKEIRDKKYEISNQLSILDWGREKVNRVNQVDQVNRANQPVTYLSYSQIETFNTCPRQYRFKYIQKIPVPSSAPASFGTSMHKTLREFYEVVKNRQNPSKKDLLSLLNQNWSAEGYASKTHELKMKKQGERMLADYYQQAYDPRQKPMALEQKFAIKVSSGLKVGGKIDRIDPSTPSTSLRAGSLRTGGGIEIIDYKTGKVMEQKEVDNSLQMTVYALAAVDPGIYRKTPEEVVLTFYFLDKNEKRSTKRTEKQLIEAKKELIGKAKEIELSDFKPTPGIWCGFCDFRLLCEAWS